MTEKKPIPILVRVSPALLKKLESAARSEQRTRNAEACRRLAESFKKPQVAERGARPEANTSNDHAAIFRPDAKGATEKKSRGQS